MGRPVVYVLARVFMVMISRRTNYALSHLHPLRLEWGLRSTAWEWLVVSELEAEEGVHQRPVCCYTPPVEGFPASIISYKRLPWRLRCRAGPGVGHLACLSPGSFVSGVLVEQGESCWDGSRLV